MRDLARSVLIGVASALAVVWVGWRGFRSSSGSSWPGGGWNGAPAARLSSSPANSPAGYPVRSSFDGSAALFASFGTIFAFWVVCCVVLPTRNARTPKPQR